MGRKEGVPMDHAKLGELIRRLRREKNMTQLQLAKELHISDKAVSKWERGLGCPDVSLLGKLAEVFAVDLKGLLSGEIKNNDISRGNMKKTKFYVCPLCGNLLLAMEKAELSCCGRKLKPIQPQKAAAEEKLSVELIDNDYFISSVHPMSKEHYITFVALLTGDSIMLRKQYPEWDLQVRIPTFARGMLLWHCSQHGLFYQLV